MCRYTPVRTSRIRETMFSEVLSKLSHHLKSGAFHFFSHHAAGQVARDFGIGKVESE